MRLAGYASALALLATPALAQQQSCAPPLTPQLRVEMYFGMGVAGRRPVSDSEWSRFVTHELTHRFPGLTMLKTRGAWRKDQHELHKRTKQEKDDTEDRPATRNAIAEVAETYKHLFH